MARRNIKEYVGISRNVISNRVYSSLASQGNKISARHKFKGLLEESIFKWFFNNATTPLRHVYAVDTTQSSIYSFEEPVKIAIAADWASDTVQCEKIGELMKQKDADYTVHLGDTYYSGSSDEINANFMSGSWPMGKVCSFALLGNHEMYHGAFPYFDALLPFFKQPNPFFCLGNEHWCILGLDTGYQSILGTPSNTDLKLEDALLHWLSETVKLAQDKRGIIVFTHHQYITAFNRESNFQHPAWQLQSFFGEDREMIWIWGHEHRFSMYGKYKKPTQADGLRFVSAYGRCIGNGGMPVEQTSKHAVDPAKAKEYNLALHDGQVVDHLPALLFQKIPIGNNGYALLEIDGPRLVINYYLSYTNDEQTVPVETLAVRETWQADNTNGKITCVLIEDLTVDTATGKSQLCYADGATISSAGI